MRGLTGRVHSMAREEGSTVALRGGVRGGAGARPVQAKEKEGGRRGRVGQKAEWAEWSGS
jgi:hypothetical protein